MTRNGLIIAATAALVAALASAAAFGGLLKDPKSMVLQKSDLPAGAARVQGGNAKACTRTECFVVWRYGAGAKRYELNSVAAVLGKGLAKQFYAEMTGDARGEPKFGAKYPLPKLGDKQFAFFAREDNEGNVIVLKGGTVWSLSVNTGRGNIRLITKAQAAAEIKRFAPKQARRVGSG
jgi:hypothetical protein